ncbi:MAG: ArsR/SmtB family transcription factor [Bacteriovoracia bacterium]
MYLVQIGPTDVFQALSDPVRLRIIRVLADPKIKEACSCDLAEALNEPEYAISRQLKVLRATGLLTAEKEGRWIYHKIQVDHPDLRRLISVISEFSDADGQCKADRKQLQRLIDARSGGRCVGQKQKSSIRETG